MSGGYVSAAFFCYGDKVSMGKREKPKVLSSYAESSRYMGMGIHFALTTLLGAGGGWWLDRSIATLPLFTLVGLLAGACAGFYHLYMKLMEIEDKERSAEK